MNDANTPPNPQPPLADTRADAAAPDQPDKPGAGPPTGRVKRRLWIQGAVALGVLVLGVLAAVLLVKAEQPPETRASSHPGPLVEVIRSEQTDVTMTVEGYGTVEPRVMVPVVPQVSGRVVTVHPSLAAGGLIRAGEPLIGIERSDYELAVERSDASLAGARSAVEQAEAAIEQARTQLQIEQAEAEVARAEWQARHPDTPADPLVLREPQIRRAEAAVSSARAQRAAAGASVRQANAALDEAKLNLSRTSIALDDDVRVLSESVDVGQYVAPGQVIATVYGVGAMDIVVMVDDRDLAWFDVPGLSPSSTGAGVGASVTIVADFAGRSFEWSGRAARMGGQVDVQSRLVPVIVEVADPFAQADGRPPLVPGMFVKAIIHGRTVPNLLIAPRHAVHDGDTVWVVRGGRLRVVKVDLARATRQTAYITAGLRDGERIVTSLLDTITDGMKVRTPADAEVKDE